MKNFRFKLPEKTKLLGSVPGFLVYLYCVFFTNGSPGYFESIGIAAFMINLWIAEPVPIYLSSLLPLILMPMHSIMNFETALSNYYSKSILLFLGGFLLAYNVEKWNLHKRIAFRLLALTGDRPKGIVLGMMLTTCLVSMWISNTATAIMMLPVAVSIVNIVADKNNPGNKAFFTCLMLGIAYGANIGGIATIIGTPPNIVYKGYSESLLHNEISFIKWMAIGVPVSLIMLGIAYHLLVNVMFRIKVKSLPEVASLLDKQSETLGRISIAERRSLIVFSLAAFFWVFSQPINAFLEKYSFDFKVEEFGVALIFSAILFIIPKEKLPGKMLLELKDFTRINWSILLLFGGGMCMAKGLESAGVIRSMGDFILSGKDMPFGLLLLVVIAMALFLTEFMSNVALAQIYIPLVFGLTGVLGLSTPHQMGIPVAIATSFAFMFPISTPPNAVVFSSGKIRMKDMMMGGFLLNIAGVLLLWFVGYYIIPLLF